MLPLGLGGAQRVVVLRGRRPDGGPVEQVADLVVGRLREVVVPDADGVERIGRR